MMAQGADFIDTESLKYIESMTAMRSELVHPSSRRLEEIRSIGITVLSSTRNGH